MNPILYRTCRALPVVVVTFLFFVSNTVLAQDENQEEPKKTSASLSVYGITGIPVSSFKDAVDNDIGGLSVGFGIEFMGNIKPKKKSSPLWLGADFGYSTFGRDKVPPYKTTYNLYTFGGISRLMIGDPGNTFVPFVDASLGLRVFNTRTKIDKDLVGTLADSEPEVIHSTNDAKLGYGAGIGFRAGKTGASFMMRLVYMWGYTVKYVKRGSVVIDSNGYVSYETDYAKAQMLQIQLGVMLH